MSARWVAWFTLVACRPPGDHVWCEGAYEGAAFNEGWSAFGSWD